MKDCVSLETARKLQDAGIKINTAMLWATKNNTSKLILKGSGEIGKLDDTYNIIPTPTTNEMLEWLPKEIGNKHIALALRPHFYYDCAKNFVCSYKTIDAKDFAMAICSDKLPQEALAQLCLWVKENGYV